MKLNNSNPTSIIEFILKIKKMKWHHIINLAEKPTFEYKTIIYAGSIG